ncbi:MAG TPA: NAD(P)-dependent oxidoreductase [Candidatus Saccharimonadales bacterium]|nr:NAD(P)-dependent oxidoreductase [Candidatus Saccharimonadales bacterium]
MSKKKILVTDSLFIFDEHVKQLNDANIFVERLDKLRATEQELISALKGKDGYILGGDERVSDGVVKSFDNLKVISVAATDWRQFVPGWREALSMGIKITNAPHINAKAVAEWLLSTGLAMNRDLFGLGKMGDKTFNTVKEISELKVGVIGLGHIGLEAARLFDAIGANVVYWSKSVKNVKFKKQNLNQLLKTSDIVLFCVSAAAGEDYVNADKLKMLKNGAIVTSLNIAVTDEEALLAELKNGRIRGFLDWTPKNPEFQKISFSNFYCSNSSSAFNTHRANKMTSDIVTRSIIKILNSQDDEYVVNY